MQDLDPKDTPGTPGTVEGQPEASASPVPQELDETARALAELKEENKKLQYRLTQQGRELKQLKDTPSAPPAGQTTEEFDWANPTRAIRQAIRGELTEFQKAQQAERRAEQLFNKTAAKYGLSGEQLNDYYGQLQEAASNPEEFADVVARMYRAEHADKAISDAAKAAQSTMQRNARGVTSESAATQSMPQQKPVDQMDDKELDEYVMRHYGKAEWPH